MCKPKLFIDFDDTLVDSLKVIVNMLNKRYNKNYSTSDVMKWDFSDCYDIARPESEKLFEEDEFWDNLIIEKNVLNILKKLQKHYTIYIISKGTPTNLHKKSQWINNNLLTNDIAITYIPLPIGVSKGSVPMDKYSIMIDDNEQYLDETNAEIKILFNRHPNRDWNSHWKGLTMGSWIQIEDFLLTLAKGWTGGIINE